LYRQLKIAQFNSAGANLAKTMAQRQEIVDLLRFLLSDDGGRPARLAGFEAQMGAVNTTDPVTRSEFMYIFYELKKELASAPAQTPMTFQEEEERHAIVALMNSMGIYNDGIQLKYVCFDRAV
jgi:hypothetical protein